MLSAKKRFKLLLLASFFLLFGVEENYCSDNSVKNDQNPKSQSQAVKGSIPIQAYIGYEIFANIFYWLFDWYQKKPGWYWYKHYRSFGYRTRLFSNRFYFDFYMRTWVSILFALDVYNSYSKMKSVSSSPEYGKDISKQKKYDFLSNMLKLCLCLMFVPSVDLNICFGDNFYLVIGFRDIIILYFGIKASNFCEQIIGEIQAVSNRAS